MKNPSRILVALALTLSAVPALAERPRGEGLEVSLGVGAILSPRPYVGASAEVFPIPVIGLRYKTFFFEGVRTGFRGRPMEHLETSIFVGMRFDGADPDDSPFLEGMDERRLSADLGGRIAGVWDHLEIDAILRRDILDRSDGTEGELGVALPFSAGAWRFKPRVAAKWQDAELVDYYYGVRPTEAKPERPAYEGAETVNLLASFNAVRPFNSGWTLLLGVNWQGFGSEIKDSPIVNDSDSLGGLAAVTYRFGAGRR